MPSTPRARSDEGSILLALLAALVVGGVAVALLAVVNMSQRTTRSDRQYNEAINGADAGIQQATNYLAELSDSSVSTVRSWEVFSADPTLRTVGDIGYEWEATKIAPQSWVVRSTGTSGDRARTVEAVVERPAKFFLAAFADIGFRMNGNNGASSYNSSGHGTGNGAVGSNGTVTMNGNAFADIIMLLGAGSSCTGNGCSSGDIVGFQDSFDLAAMSTGIQDAMASNCSPNPPTASYVASTSPPLVPGNTYCFVNVTFDVNTPLAGANGANPVTIYMTGTMSVANHVDVHCPSCNGSSIPDARGLIINSLGPEVRFGNHSTFAGAVAAPDATCRGNPSNAQADIFGSIVCDDLTNQGGWNFYFDDRLLQIGDGSFDVVEWAEVVGEGTVGP